MNGKVKLITLILIGLLVLFIVFIGKRNNEEDGKEDTNTYSQTENVYFWYSDESFSNFYTQAAVAFNEINPDIRVIPKLISGDEYLETINKASIDKEEFPDAYVVSNDALEKAYLSGLASEVSKTTRVVNTEHFSQAAIDAVTYDHKIVGYPLYFETSILVYNKTYLKDWLSKVKEEGKEKEEQAGGNVDLSDESGDSEYTYSAYDYRTVALDDLIPKTIEDIKNFANSYEAPDGVDGVFKWDVSDIFFNYFFVGDYMIVGGPSGDDSSNIDIYNENTKNCMKAYQELNQFFSIDATTSNYNSMIEEFVDGKFVFSIATSDIIRKLETALEERAVEKEELDKAYEEKKLEVDSKIASGELSAEDGEIALKKYEDALIDMYEFDYARIPQLSLELNSRSLSVTNCIVINGYSERREAANRFAAFVSTQYAENIYQRTGKIAASTDAGYEDEALLLFQEEYANSIPIPKIVEASNFWVQLEVAFTQIWKGEDIDSYLKKLSEQILSQISTDE